jgi:hypothetical protein
MRPKVLDIVAVILGIGAIVAFSVFAYSETGAGSQALIQADSGDYVYSLETEVDVEIDGPIGTSHIRVEDGGVRFVSSPCRDKICIAGGLITESGQWVACLPNRIFVRVEGGEDTGVDGQTF